ncbi:beta-lactamase family protein [Herbidospora galbida]|uniref:Beta-lactamase family protein n=1 Tax=Herbidospora galbida TaxID=2575442 RepID=A0A4V6XB81_9ACTN|nr:serine hydrolase domain-containing protein [Herbidospora galbida]TKK81053.1 beta-lactamase family protein [Herbidospora galbida]
MSDLQGDVQAAIDELVEKGVERGVQVSVYLGGEPVVDAVAGVADPATGRAVTPETPFYNYSVGKGVTSTVLHVLAERGLIGYDTPIAEVWPEFAAHGKDRATVRMALNHTVGVPGIPLTTIEEDLCDWDAMCAAIAAAEPWWEPGTEMGYHAYSFGYIVGEIVRRVTGRKISEVLLDEVAGPLGVAGELYFGMPADQHHRLAVLEDALPAEPPPGLPTELPDLPMFKAGPMALSPTAALGNRPDILAADIPAGGKMTARAMARLYSALMTEVDGVRLISPERLREISAISFEGVDAVFGNPVRWGLGYGIGHPGAFSDPDPTTFGVSGAGGGTAYADTKNGMAFALTKNVLSADFTTATTISDLVRRELAR